MLCPPPQLFLPKNAGLQKGWLKIPTLHALSIGSPERLGGRPEWGTGVRNSSSHLFYESEEPWGSRKRPLSFEAVPSRLCFFSVFSAIPACPVYLDTSFDPQVIQVIILSSAVFQLWLQSFLCCYWVIRFFFLNDCILFHPKAFSTPELWT